MDINNNKHDDTLEYVYNPNEAQINEAGGAIPLNIEPIPEERDPNLLVNAYFYEDGEYRHYTVTLGSLTTEENNNSQDITQDIKEEPFSEPEPNTEDEEMIRRWSKSPKNREIEIRKAYVPLGTGIVDEYLKNQQQKKARKPKHVAKGKNKVPKGKRPKPKVGRPPKESKKRKLNVVDFRKTNKRQDPTPRKKRSYNKRDWDKKGLGKVPHKSMIPVRGKQLMATGQIQKRKCMLCEGKKPFFTQYTKVMQEHYGRVHYRRVFKIKSYYHLLCKCKDFQSRKPHTDRNSHHHCPVCWKPLEKSTDLEKHVITEHAYDEVDVKIKHFNY